MTRVFPVLVLAALLGLGARCAAQQTVPDGATSSLFIAASMQSGPPITLPPDSIYKPGMLLVRFHQDMIQPEYFCPSQSKDGESRGLASIADSLRPSIYPSALLIQNGPVVSTLQNAAARLEPMWPACQIPCLPQTRIEVTRWGDTLHFPYWTNYIVRFPDSVSVTGMAYALMSAAPWQVYAVPILKKDITESRGPAFDGFYPLQKGLQPLDSMARRWGANVEGAWDYTTGSWSIGMASFDAGGCDTSHPDFKHFPPGGGAAQTNIVLAKNFSGGALTIGTHATAVAGIMGALRNNMNTMGGYEGVAGVAAGNWSSGNKGCRFYVAQTPSLAGEIRAFDELAGTTCSDGIRVIDIGYGNAQRPTTIEAWRGLGAGALEYQGFARTYRRCIVVTNGKMEGEFASDLDTVSAPKYDLPNGYNDQWVIGVGASRHTSGELSTETSYGGNMRLMSPGTAQGIYLLTPSASYGIPASPTDTISASTSWASPTVAGTAALIFSRDTMLLNDDAAGLMEATARKTGYRIDQQLDSAFQAQAVPYDKHTGYGLLDAGEAVRRVTDVRHGSFDLGALTDSAYADRVIVEDISDGFSVEFQQTETTDPLDISQYSSYSSKTYKLTARVTIDSAGKRLDHAWGIGMGHKVVPNTTGWDYGPRDAAHFCSQTPYAKVLPDSIDNAARTFSMVTYLYRFIGKRRLGGAVDTLYYPTTTRNAVLSYGYLLSPIPSGVRESAAMPSTCTIAAIQPNPVRERAALVRVDITERGEYLLELYDARGASVMPVRSVGILEPGTHELRLDVLRLEPGNYICQIRTVEGGAAANRTFTVVR